MKSRPFVRSSGSAILVCLVSYFVTASVFAQSIRLRNETITPEPTVAAAAAMTSTPEPPVSGLFLIQLAEARPPAWREQLEEMGATLLHYVPDQAFLVKLENARPTEVRQLNFVRWLGTYRPDHKLHLQLQSAVAAASTAPVDVAILLSPRLTEAEATATQQTLASVHQEARHGFGRVLRGSLDPAHLPALATSDAVLWIEPMPRMRLLDEVASRIVAGDGPPGQTLMQSLGYDGAGVTVAVADSGLDSGEISIMHPDLQGRVTALFHYGLPGQLEDAADEHSHGTHCAGIIAGNGAVGETDEQGLLYGLGVAPGASLIGQRIFDAQGGYAPPPSFEQMTRDAKRAGADIGSNSWGDNTQGRYDLSAMEFDALVRDADFLTLGDQPYILEFSAGNAGPGARTINTPAVAKNVIATGAANNDRRNLPIEEFTIYDTGPETMADFSSRGPCEDGRIKPDLVAPGSWIASLRSIYANDDFAWWPISGSYMYQGGTSQAGPHVSGAAAVFVQYYRAHHGGATPSPALVKAALINSAADLDDAEDTAPVPNNDEGWGRLNLPALIGSLRDYDFTDQIALLTNQADYEKRILIGSADEPLKVTLAYTDVPGNPAAVIALVNDLDLEVFAPDGRVYRGNRFHFGESIPDAIGADTVNNVEAVHLFAPVPGEYVLRVRARRVVQDARRDTEEVDQDFALVVSGAFGTPGVGIVTFDRPVYRAPDQIRLTLVDYDLAGQPGVNLLLRSGAEPAGENVPLFAHGSSGLFTGAIATATSPAIGQLHLAHGDDIEAVYADATPPANRVFTALADLVPPVIANVRATNRFGQPVVSWTTDEETKAIVRYGSSTPNLAQTNIVFDTAHEFALLNFPPDAVIQFLAVAEDAAGNRTTNDNVGLFFTVTNLPAPGVFLLDSYTDSGGFIAAPPLSGYTDALNALGRAYSVFDARSGAEPTLTELQAHRSVIWRMDEISAPPVTLAQKIADYVNGGGSLLIASMEAVTRLTEAGLAGMNTSILQVQSYTEDQPVDAILGAPGDPVGAGLDTLLDYSPYDELLSFLAFLGITDPSDWIVPTTNAAPILLADGQIVGVRSPKTGVDLPGRVVYLSFPLDAVPLGNGIGNNRAGLLQNILNFLSPEPGRSSLTLDSDVYSVPGRAIIEVEDLDLRGLGQASVTVSSPQQTNEVALFETVRAGLFRGNLIFTPTNTGLPGTLLVAPDDTVAVSYFDVSASQTLVATAVIETNAPVISDVFIEPGYLEAIVSWFTSKDSDALVLYSESPDSFPINFTAYDPLPGQYHELFLTGLKPNTKYYLRVASRDRAGNTTVDDNGGQFYTFTTLQPLTPPWSDNMETNSLLWSVISPDESETQWRRGTPGGGEMAHSPVNCWGSNLGGGPVSLLESYLISPGVLLSGGNRVTLRFWHNYDFFSQSEFEFQLAGIFIITNVLTSPQLLRQIPEDSSFGWEEMEIDLTPYLGHVAYIAWYHFLFSFDAPPRLGWLVDDVSITVGTVTPGTVQITNNLWQAVFALTGPTGRVGGGQWTVITNAAPGQYAIEFGDVPHHSTPLPQTNTLAAGGTVTFHGHYTFPDANTNGIPDGWEQVYFGGVSPERTSLTDTDDDGLSDYAEYVAGTNPTNQLSALRLTPTLAPGGNSLELQWPSAPGHGYRVLRSADAFDWTPATDWIRAASAITGTNLPTLGDAPQFLRVQASP
ncbi:MAG: S8 family serine peptidase [Verrucomicrobiae bacterium]|nr:S8 family serine peptidase [Verrucomicrobiae bacterium]